MANMGRKRIFVAKGKTPQCSELRAMIDKRYEEHRDSDGTERRAIELEIASFFDFEESDEYLSRRRVNDMFFKLSKAKGDRPKNGKKRKASKSPMKSKKRRISKQAPEDASETLSHATIVVEKGKESPKEFLAEMKRLASVWNDLSEDGKEERKAQLMGGDFRFVDERGRTQKEEAIHQKLDVYMYNYTTPSPTLDNPQPVPTEDEQLQAKTKQQCFYDEGVYIEERSFQVFAGLTKEHGITAPLPPPPPFDMLDSVDGIIFSNSPYAMKSELYCVVQVNLSDVNTISERAKMAVGKLLERDDCTVVFDGVHSVSTKGERLLWNLTASETLPEIDDARSRLGGFQRGTMPIWEREFLQSFKIPEILPGGEWCMMKDVSYGWFACNASHLAMLP